MFCIIVYNQLLATIENLNCIKTQFSQTVSAYKFNKETMGLSPKEMEDAIIKNLREKTGKSINEWLIVLSEEKFSNKKEMKLCLKEKYKIGHFQAQTIVKLYLEKNNV